MFRHLKVGDRVQRNLSSANIPMLMEVVEVKDDILVCAAVHPASNEHPERLVAGGWEFDRDTGVEEDEELGWGKKFGKTGSMLVPTQ